MFWVYISLAIISDIFGIGFAKKFAITNDYTFLIISIIFSMLVGLFFAFSLRFNPLAVANTVLVVLGLLYGIILGVSYFHEKLAPVQWIGIAVCIIGVILIQWPSSNA